MREGSTTRDGFFRFLQSAQLLSAGTPTTPPDIPAGLTAAIARIAPGSDAAAFLANVADTTFLSRVWSAFWFEWIATRDVLTPWIYDGKLYSTPNAHTRIHKDDGTGSSQIFEGRADGLKENIVELLNTKQINEATGWEYFAAGIVRPGRPRKQGVRDRAHSYREDIDSALAHLQWIEAEGRPTDFGYRYMAICERYGGPNSPAALEYLGASLLQTGRYGAFLHYIYRLSERLFTADPLAFATLNAAGQSVFTDSSYSRYLAVLVTQMTDELKVMRRVSGRGRPRTRTAFQVELTLLRNYGFVSKTRHRLGIGIPIDWEHVMDALNIDL
jgi:hypothetical protein